MRARPATESFLELETGGFIGLPHVATLGDREVDFVAEGRLVTPILGLKYARRLGMAPAPAPPAIEGYELALGEPLAREEALAEEAEQDQQGRDHVGRMRHDHHGQPGGDNRLQEEKITAAGNVRCRRQAAEPVKEHAEKGIRHQVVAPCLSYLDSQEFS